MAATYAAVHTFASGNEEQYRAALAAVHPDGGKSLPPGQLVHAAGPTADGGWVVVALFDSSASWETFRDETLLPGLGSIEGGFSGPPEETTFEIANYQTS